MRRYHGVRLRVVPAPPSDSWAEGLEDVRRGVALGILYVVVAVLVCLLDGVARLDRTAEGMSGIPAQVPYWHVVK